jgi:hypothetical protein
VNDTRPEKVRSTGNAKARKPRVFWSGKLNSFVLEGLRLKIFLNDFCSWVQFKSNACPEHGHGASFDFKVTAYYCKLSADQGNVCGQWGCGCCLQHGLGVDIDWKSVGLYFKLAADQEDPAGQFRVISREWDRGRY